MEHKILKMHLGTWRKLRGLFPGLPGETADNYFQRIIREVKEANGNKKSEFDY